MNPLLQAHVNDPAVFVQAALLSQSWVLREHSSLSKLEKDKIPQISLSINQTSEIRGFC